MAKYLAQPGYEVIIGESESIVFNKVGEYETDDARETNILDKLAPRYITKVAGSTEKPAAAEKKKPEAKAKETPASGK